MKTFLVFLVVGWTSSFYGQETPSEFIASLNDLAISDEDWSFKTKMTEAAKALDDCANEEGGCALQELEEEEQGSLWQQMLKAGISGAYTQKIMVDFEKWILKGKGGKLLKRMDIVLAYEKHPGYSFTAMCFRMDIYIRKMNDKSESPIAEENEEEIEEEFSEE